MITPPTVVVTYTTRSGEVKSVQTKLGGAKGYAAAPGTGPNGETCGTCANCATLSFYSGRRVFKCKLVNWRHSPRSDIRKRSPACVAWKAGKGETRQMGKP